jgi:hypothetical protein
MKSIILIMLTVVILNCDAQINEKYKLDFEKVMSGSELPQGWFKWGYYELSTDSISHTGSHAGKITSPEEGSSFGSLAYKIPANYKGDSIHLVGFMKIKNVENGFTGLLLRVDGNGTRGIREGRDELLEKAIQLINGDK